MQSYNSLSFLCRAAKKSKRVTETLTKVRIIFAHFSIWLGQCKVGITMSEKPRCLQYIYPSMNYLSVIKGNMKDLLTHKHEVCKVLQFASKRQVGQETTESTFLHVLILVLRVPCTPANLW